MDNFAAMAPFTFEQRLGKVVGVNAKIGGMNPVIDIRSWGYLTGQGHGALGLTQHDAAAEQDAFGELVAELLNKHFKELACHNLAMAILNKRIMHHEGNLIIRTAADVEKYKAVTSIGGSLRIEADAKLDALTSVGGYIRIEAAAELGALTSVGGYLYIRADAELGALTSVGGFLYIDADASLGALTSVGGDLYIFVDADLGALTSVGGYQLPDAETTEKTCV